MSTVSVYKNGILLGSGNMTAGSNSITSYSGIAPKTRRNVRIVVTNGADTGKTFLCYIALDAGTTLTASTVQPYA